MRPNKKRLSLTVAIALMVLMAGCAGLVGGEDIEEDELEQKTLEAMEDVDTFSMTYNQSVEVMGTTSQMSAEGVIDREAQRAQMTTTMDGIPIEQYVIDDTLYQETGGEWVKVKLPEEILWEEHETAQQQKALEMGDLDIRETTTFDGNEVYVVDIELDEDELADVVNDSDAGMDGGFEGEFRMDAFMDDVEFNDVRVTQYIDTDTYHVRYVNMSFEMETSMGPVTIELDMTLSDFNEDVDIELPPEAETAVDLDEWIADGFGDDFSDGYGY